MNHYKTKDWPRLHTFLPVMDTAPCPLQPQRKKKPHQTFRQVLSSLAKTLSFSASPPLFKEKEVCPTTFTMSSRDNKGKKKTTFYRVNTPFHGSGRGACSAAEGASSSSKRP
jgi:hypothetical protein